MTTIFETMSQRARDCQQLIADIDLIRPLTFESSPSVETVKELLNGAAAIYELRFAALLDAYSVAIKEEGFSHYEVEECVMNWWGACSDLRCAAEGVENGILDTDGLDNALLGISALSLVRGARFVKVFEAARSTAMGAGPIEAS